MPTRLCANPGCPNPAQYRGRCREHAQTVNRDTHRNRPVYNSKRWQILRRWYLHHHPLCERCAQVATDVHHRQDLTDGGNPWSPGNLEALCRSCHSRETRYRQAA